MKLSLRVFHCVTISGSLTREACAARWRAASRPGMAGVQSGPRICAGCNVGRAHARNQIAETWPTGTKVMWRDVEPCSGESARPFRGFDKSWDRLDGPRNPRTNFVFQEMLWSPWDDDIAPPPHRSRRTMRGAPAGHDSVDVDTLFDAFLTLTMREQLILFERCWLDSSLEHIGASLSISSPGCLMSIRIFARWRAALSASRGGTESVLGIIARTLREVANDKFASNSPMPWLGRDSVLWLGTPDAVRAAITAAVHCDRLMERRGWRDRPRKWKPPHHAGSSALRDWVSVVGIDAFARECGVSKERIVGLCSRRQVWALPPGLDLAERIERMTGIPITAWRSEAVWARMQAGHRATQIARAA